MNVCGRLLGALGMVFLTATALAQPQRFWQETERGWFWYATPPPVPAPAPPVSPPTYPPKSAADLSDAPEVAQHALLQRRLENSRSIAIMRPTPANLSRYLYLQREVMDRSAEFADVWQRVVWADPALDHSVQSRPTNSLAQRTWDAQHSEQQEQLVARAAQEHGLFFVFGHDCLHCAQMAQVLTNFTNSYGMAVQAVAVAGAQDPAFPQAWPDNGFATASGAVQLPALLLARLIPGVPQLTPVAYGPLTEVELAERIAVLTGQPVGSRF